MKIRCCGKRAVAWAVLLSAVCSPLAFSASIITNVPLGTNPNLTIADTLRNVYYVCIDGAVVVVDPSTGAAEPITTRAGTHTGLALDPERNRLYVANNSGNGRIYVINTATRAVVTTVDVSAPINCIAVAPAMGTILVGTPTGLRSFTPGNLQQLDVAYFFFGSSQNISAIAVNPLLSANPIFIRMADGSTAYISNPLFFTGGAAFAVMAETTPAPMGDPASAMAINPRTNRAYFFHPTSTGVSVGYVDGGGAYTQTAPVAAAPGAPEFLIIASAIAINPVNNQIFVAGFGGNAPLMAVLVDSTSGGTAPVIAPMTGSPVAMTDGYYVKSIVVNPLTGLAHALTVFAGGVTNPNNVDGFLDTVSTEGGTATFAGGFNVGIGEPNTLSINPLLNRACVTKAISASVTLLDLSLHTLSAPAATGTNPWIIDVNPVTDRFYVVNLTSPSSVTVLSGAGNLITSIPIPQRTGGLAVDPITNRIYALGGSNLYVINGATNAVIATVAGAGGSRVAFNPITRRAFVAEFDTDSVKIVDTVTNTLVATVIVGDGPFPIGVNTRTNQVFVANTRGDTLSVIDGSTAEVLATLPTQDFPIQVAVDSELNRVFVPNQGSNSITVVDADTFNTVNIPVGSAPLGAVVNPVTHRVYAVSQAADTVTVIDGNTLSLVTTIPVSDGPQSVTVNPATNQIYVANQGAIGNPTRGNIDIIDGLSNTIVGSLPANLTSGADVPFSVAVNPVSDTAAASGFASSTARVINVKPEQASPMSLAIALSGQVGNNVIFSPYPTFTFTISGGTARRVYFQIDSLQREWLPATFSGGSTWTATSPALQTVGPHIVYAFATDGQDFVSGTSSQIGSTVETNALTQTTALYYAIQHNNIPTLNTVADRNLAEDAGAQNIGLSGITVGNPNETGQSLTLSASTDNPTLLTGLQVVYTSPAATGSVLFTPAANRTGTAIVTLTLRDSGGTSNNGKDTLVSRFTVTVNPVNDTPTLDSIANRTVLEEALPINVALSGIGSGPLEDQALTVTATSSAPGIVPNPSVTYDTPNTAGALTLAPAANAHGTATITVRVTDDISIDGAAKFIERTFTVTVTPVNDAPTLDPIAPLNIAEDAGLQSVSLTGITSGPNDGAQTISISAASSNPALIPTPSVSYTSPTATGGLTFTPVANASGTAIVTVTVSDNGGLANGGANTFALNFTVTVAAQNDSPTLDAIPNQTVLEDQASQAVLLTGITSGPLDPAQTLTFTATSNKPTVIANPTVSYTQGSAFASLLYKPLANQFTLVGDPVTITVDLSDGAATTQRTFTIDVTPVNDAPTISAIGNQATPEDTPLVVNFAGVSTGPNDGTQSPLVVSAVSNDTSIVASVSVSYIDGNPTGSLTINPAPDANGATSVTVTVSDAGGTGNGGENAVSQTFNVAVTPVNDAPTLDDPADVVVNEDASAQSFTLTGITPGFGDGVQTLTVAATSNNPTIIPNPVVAYTSPNGTATLTFQPLPDANSQVFGPVTITVTVTDNGATGGSNVNTFSQGFTITVTPVNDTPTLNPIDPVTILEDQASPTINFTGITSGNGDGTQTFTVSAASSDQTLIASAGIAVAYNQNSSDATGSLSFTPQPDANGSATITVTVTDSGGGVVLRSFLVTVSPLNDEPRFAAITTPAPVDEDSGAHTVAISGINSGAANEAQALALTVTTDTPALFSNLTVSPAAIAVGGPTAATLNYTSAPDARGSAQVTVTLKDDGGTVSLGDDDTFSQTFTIQVLPINDPPALDPVVVPSIVEDGGLVTIQLTGINSGGNDGPQTLTFNAVPSDNVLLGGFAFSYTSPATTATITFTPPPNAFGTTQINVTLSDDGGGSATTIRSVPITVRPVNDRPSFVKGPDLTALETGVETRVSGWATGVVFGPANEASQKVSRYIVTTDNDAAFAQRPAVSADGTLTFTPANNTNVPTPITVSVAVQDDGGTSDSGIDTSAVQTFTLTLTPVADTLIVTNTGDAAPNSLRDCLNRARRGDTVLFDPRVFDLFNSDAETLINVLTELPPLDDGQVTVDASGRRVSVNGSGASSSCGLVITSNENIVRGLTIIGFPRSGVCVKDGAQNNVIGGSREIGGGPNGQGLRISGNGTFGIEISGAGTDGNVVKGCWIGLAASGSNLQPNLAGVIVQGGAKNNVIGGAAAGEANVISGNSLEGITIAGEGTDGNSVAGNMVGAAAVEATTTSGASTRATSDDALSGRGGVGNGSSGVFLSKGTQNSQLGAETAAATNTVAFNGGSGVEVRASTSRRNSAKGNRISRNSAKGIALFDGSNDNIQPPVIEKVVVIRKTASSNRVRVTGTAVAGGTVELFNDPGEQGEQLLGRGSSNVGAQSREDETLGGRGSFTFEVDVTLGRNINANVTDSQGNTSAFTTGAPPPDFTGGGSATLPGDVDSDGDGITDQVEALAGTDPLTVEDAPAVPGPLAIDSLSVSLNFAGSGGNATFGNKTDSVKASLRMVLPEGFLNPGSEVALLLGTHVERLTLDAKGASPKGKTSAKLKGGSATVPALPGAAGRLTFTISRPTLASAVAGLGLSERTTASSGERIVVPLALALTAGGKKYVYVGTTPVIYKATLDRNGRAKTTKK